jgi:uncharacterized protein with HEPN domain
MDRDKGLLLAILRELNMVPQLMEDTSLEEFLTSEKTQRAVCMTLLNIGELVKGLSDNIRQKHSYVPWKEIAGLRDITAHKYQSLNMERIYMTARDYIPKFQSDVLKILQGF